MTTDGLDAMGANENLRRHGMDFLRLSLPYRYVYRFSWLGRPIIQLPQDILAVQELIWHARPELIVETGIAHGGSLVLSASILELLGGDGRVVGIDVELRRENRVEIEKHRLAERIVLIEGSSTDATVVEQVKRLAAGKRVMVLLDSDHTHEHVLQELRLYSPLVACGCYVVVFDTTIEDMPADSYPGRRWTKTRNPKTAVWQFLGETDRFVIDEDIQKKLIITAAWDGYLKCVRD